MRTIQGLHLSGVCGLFKGQGGPQAGQGCKGGRALKGNAWSEIARTAQYCLQNENKNTNTTSNTNTNKTKTVTSNTNTNIFGNTNTKIG